MLDKEPIIYHLYVFSYLRKSQLNLLFLYFRSKYRFMHAITIKRGHKFKGDCGVVYEKFFDGEKAINVVSKL